MQDRLVTDPIRDLPHVTIFCITTNAIRRGDGSAVMGAGIAEYFAKKHPELPAILGALIKKSGNHVHELGVFDGRMLLSFPTKNHFARPSELGLIIQSAGELWNWWQQFPYCPYVALPRPGCGNGGLSWSVVRPAIEGILSSDSFIAYDRMGEASYGIEGYDLPA